MSLIEAVLKLPINQNVIAGSFSKGSAMYLIKEMRAEKKAETITPESANISMGVIL